HPNSRIWPVRSSATSAGTRVSTDPCTRCTNATSQPSTSARPHRLHRPVTRNISSDPGLSANCSRLDPSRGGCWLSRVGPPHRCLRLGKHRHLPSAIPLNSQPQDGPPDGLCGLSLVASHHLLVAQVLHPLALLAADLGGVLPALHNGVPLCAGSKSAGNF